MTEQSSNLDRRIVEAVDRMPAFPKSVQRILELTRDIRCQPKDLVGVIEKDPVITVKILRVLNSAYYGLPQKINSVNYAVVYLGFNTIKNLALSIAAIGALPANNKAGIDIHRYLFHSLATAGVARQLCSKIGGELDPMDCHIAGLLHDFGRVVFAQFMPVEFKAAQMLHLEHGMALSKAEQQIVGTDHAMVGAMLARKWQFPDTLAECIRLHHAGGAEHSTMSAIVYAANLIGDTLSPAPDGGQGSEDEDVERSDDEDEFSAALAERLPPGVAALCGGSLEEVTESLGDLSKVVEEATLFSKIGDGK
ncbi:hypothetical protein BH11PSE11_BH11PSE11_03650 [soil metagenome]